jgi:tetratricopeptide (TPR) repeat protein
MSVAEKRTPEATSLFGKPLYAVQYPAETAERYARNLAEAEARHREHPEDEDAAVWHGRRLGYLTRYREAIEVYTRALATHPRSFVLLRHRGHRLISIRKFREAAVDLAKARELSDGVPDQVEPDGEPNKSGIPTSTVRFNILYHLGLAHYLLGDFGTALEAYRACMEYSTKDPDSLVATSDWLYMTLRRLGRQEEAERVLEPITAELPLVENFAYHHRLLLYKGIKKPEELLGAESTTHHDTATHGYGIGNWLLCNGDTAGARKTFERVLATSFWPAFGFIAAEADMKRGF